jgi:hypothetical protein
MRQVHLSLFFWDRGACLWRALIELGQRRVRVHLLSMWAAPDSDSDSKEIYALMSSPDTLCCQPQHRHRATQRAMSASPFSAAHRRYVKSLYKRMLENERNWVVRYDLWRARACAVRAEFERNR